MNTAQRNVRIFLTRERFTADERAEELTEAAQLLHSAAEKLALAGRYDLAMSAQRIALEAEPA